MPRDQSGEKVFHTFNDYFHDKIGYQGAILCQEASPAELGTTRSAITFTEKGDKRLGINLAKALKEDPNALSDGKSVCDIPSWTIMGPSLYIHWPGYHPWTRPLSFKSANVTKTQLAREVAELVRIFLVNQADTPSSEKGYSVNRFTVEELYLIELRPVMMTHWQPVLAFIQ